MSNKKYYWLKFQKDFFTSKRIKKLRKLAGGDTYTIIYLKMQLLSLENGGVLEYTGLEESFADELALDIDENNDNVQVTINYLLNCGLLVEDGDNYTLPYVVENTGEDNQGLEKIREQNRIRKQNQRLREKEVKLLNENVTSHVTVTRSHALDIDKDIDIDKEYRNKEINKYTCMHEAGYTIFMQLPLNTNESYPIYECDIEEYKELYPNVDIKQQIRAMKGWLDANPKNRKTKSGIKRFINGWLSREQDKPRNKNYNTEQIKATQPTYDDSNNIQVSQEEVDEFFRKRNEASSN